MNKRRVLAWVLMSPVLLIYLVALYPLMAGMVYISNGPWMWPRDFLD